jgi:hypothetical protein
MDEKRRGSGIDPRLRLSTLWIVVMFNMVFADILSFMMPGALKEIMEGSAGGLAVSGGLLLLFAILLEIPIAMIFLSRVLGRRANRVANVAASVVTMAFVVGGGSPYPHYFFFAGVEVLCMLIIIWWSWKWPRPAMASPQAGGEAGSPREA